MHKTQNGIYSVQNMPHELLLFRQVFMGTKNAQHVKNVDWHCLCFLLPKQFLIQFMNENQNDQKVFKFKKKAQEKKSCLNLTIDGTLISTKSCFQRFSVLEYNQKTKELYSRKVLILNRRRQSLVQSEIIISCQLHFKEIKRSLAILI